MLVACSNLCFSHLSLSEALGAMREMQFAQADLSVHEAGPHLTPSEVQADVGRVAQRLKAANLPVAALHFAPAEPDGPQGRSHLRAVCRLARILAVPVLTVAAAVWGSDLDAEAARLGEWNRIAQGDGVILTVETHSATLTADPQAAVELCRRVRGLGVTLDPSHYQVGPHAGANTDALMRHVRHVRLRDSGTKPDAFQVRVGQGEIDFARLLTQLERNSYDRALTVDIRELAGEPYPVRPEVRKLKYLLESQV